MPLYCGVFLPTRVTLVTNRCTQHTGQAIVVMFIVIVIVIFIVLAIVIAIDIFLDFVVAVVIVVMTAIVIVIAVVNASYQKVTIACAFPRPNEQTLHHKPLPRKQQPANHLPHDTAILCNISYQYTAIDSSTRGGSGDSAGVVSRANNT